MNLFEEDVYGIRTAVERLALDIGAVVCASRRGWKRVYDLPERVLPAAVLGPEPDDRECVRRLVGLAGAALGVATLTDLSDYHRLTRAQVAEVVADSGLAPVRVEGWPAAWADPAALEAPARGRHRTTLLSPFDSLVWDRRRTARVFRFVHALEAYKPRAARRHGYFAMPLLAGGHLVGRVDPQRSGRTLVARQVSLDGRGAAAAMAAALREAAQWVGADGVVVERVEPEPLRPVLRAAVEDELR